MYIMPLRYIGRRRGIPRGVPDVLCQLNNRARKIPPARLPLPEQAVQAYRNTTGVLTDPSPYGNDPLAQDSTKKDLRMQAFHDRFPSFDAIFHDLVNGNSAVFKQALLFFIDITRRMSCTYLTDGTLAHAHFYSHVIAFVDT